MPTESPRCNNKWDFQEFGHDWECKCEEGYRQSPIDLPNKHLANELEC